MDFPKPGGMVHIRTLQNGSGRLKDAKVVLDDNGPRDANPDLHRIAPQRVVAGARS
jgi:hypothetical protein